MVAAVARLAKGPSFTLAVTQAFRAVILHIASALMGLRSDSTSATPASSRVHDALKSVALIRLLDIAPHAQRLVTAGPVNITSER